MEFYAAWCPACKHFQPHYDKVAAYFYGTPRPKPEVYVARVDCATEVQWHPSHLLTATLALRPPAGCLCDRVSHLQWSAVACMVQLDREAEGFA